MALVTRTTVAFPHQRFEGSVPYGDVFESAGSGIPLALTLDSFKGTSAPSYWLKAAFSFPLFAISISESIEDTT